MLVALPKKPRQVHSKARAGHTRGPHAHHMHAAETRVCGVCGVPGCVRVVCGVCGECLFYMRVMCVWYVWYMCVFVFLGRVCACGGLVSVRVVWRLVCVVCMRV